MREENYEKILIGNNFVTDDVLIERNVTPYDFEAFWVTVPQYVISLIFIYFTYEICYWLLYFFLFKTITFNLLSPPNSSIVCFFLNIYLRIRNSTKLEIVNCSPDQTTNSEIHFLEFSRISKSVRLFWWKSRKINKQNISFLNWIWNEIRNSLSDPVIE